MLTKKIAEQSVEFLSSRVISWSYIWIAWRKTVFPKKEFGNVKRSLTLKVVMTKQPFLKKRYLDYNIWLWNTFVNYFGFFFQIYNLSALRQKGESQNIGNKKTKHAKFSEKTNIFYPLIRTCAYQGIRNVRFSENLVCFVFLFPPSWDSLFCVIIDKFRIKLEFLREKNL